MDIIVRGEPHEIDFVRRFCRDKVRRGVLAILPATRPASDEVVRLRNERDETTKENERLRERVSELENQLSNVESNVDTSDVNVDTSDVKVDTSANNIDSVPKSTESTPGLTEQDNHDAMDDKYVDIEDLLEVDLDGDDKSVADNDTKDVSTEDVKEAAPAKKTSTKRSKSN